MNVQSSTTSNSVGDIVSRQALLKLRSVVVLGTVRTGYLIPGIFNPATCDQKVKMCRAQGMVARALPLLAPYDIYEELDDNVNIVALHIGEGGQMEAYGPFDCIEDAYDYFPDHSTPHDTTVTVFEVQRNQGEIAA